MTSLEAVQYKRTTDMETMYQMLCKEQSITEAWHGFAEMIAKVVKAGVNVDFDERFRIYGSLIAYFLERLCIRHHKDYGEWLQVTDEEKEIVAWQWFYSDIMETVLFDKTEIKTSETCIA